MKLVFLSLLLVLTPPHLFLSHIHIVNEGRDYSLARGRKERKIFFLTAQARAHTKLTCRSVFLFEKGRNNERNKKKRERKKREISDEQYVAYFLALTMQN